MGTPAAHLPPALAGADVARLMESLGLPAPAGVEVLRATAEYHAIYLVRFAAAAAAPRLAALSGAEPDGSVVLVLRVSGRHMARIKTLNEVAVMRWVREHTTIPVPAVVAFDASEDNAIGHEFTLLERAPGTSVDRIYDALGDAAKRSLVEQLADFVVQLHAQAWLPGFVGGLAVGDDGAVVPGPAVDETFWQLPDVREHWGPDVAFEALNPVDGPHGGWAAFNSACLERYVFAIERHPALQPYRDLVPRIRDLVAAVAAPDVAAQIDDVKYVLAHKDLHFANVMCDDSTPQCRITAVLDWEFSGVVPAPRWNPPLPFSGTARPATRPARSACG